MTLIAATPSALKSQKAPAPSPAVTYEFVVGSSDGQRVTVGRVLRETWLHSLALVVVAVVAAQFLVLPIVNQRAQMAVARELQQRFATAAGTIGHSDISPLPTEPAAIGSAIAALRIPALGLEQVVVEGARGAQVLAGPGHVAGTAGIGERGTAVIAGHRSASGAAFGLLPSLKVGDVISTVTVAGPLDYRVTSVSSQLPDLTASSGDRSRLVLATSAPAGLALSDVFVTAESTAPAYPSTPQNRLQDGAIRSIDPDAAPSLVAWLLLLLGFVTLARFWLRAGLMDRLIVWTVAAPVVAFIGVLVARAIAALLPATL